MGTPYVPVDPWLRVDEAAAIARVSVKTLRKAITSGQLRAIRIGAGRVYRIRASWVDAWLEMFSA